MHILNYFEQVTKVSTQYQMFFHIEFRKLVLKLPGRLTRFFAKWGNNISQDLQLKNIHLNKTFMKPEIRSQVSR